MDIKRAEKEYKALLESELERITAELKKLGAEKILLFGSYAAGRKDLLTDLDIIVVLKSDLPFIERIGFIYRKVAPRVAADILVYTPEEWQTVKKKPFFKKAAAEGRVLYEKVGNGRG
ncbi:nucleotidyltransferase domain-containing protein [Thermosediminibacter oceani]|uniref:DNA polymerase beta domain protein region n=1 Tax=Thermosediminibacter oceani (strain ATCC BAA-1034 / DSM 16646 / JW/IW-1228P) TaxID=555079 RepID=D9S226_THEOJ|nr:nucleotidyltransferase domain-containing protein [Thermosediminibacter oceani]ADL07453.1 DNA polymerase beta domain protein region [Thermosediminibacter oceani DSM 16646]